MEISANGRFPDRAIHDNVMTHLIPKGAGPNHVYFTISGGDGDYQAKIGRLGLTTNSAPGISQVPRTSMGRFLQSVWEATGLSPARRVVNQPSYVDAPV